MSDTLPVTVAAMPLEPVRRGNIRFLARAEVTVGGVSLWLEGLTVRLERDGSFSVWMPCFRHPASGLWCDAMTLPSELARAVAEAVLGQVPGGMVIAEPLVLHDGDTDA